MILTTIASLSWFNDGCCDVKYLDLWQDVTLNFSAAEAKGPEWHHDQYEHTLGQDKSGVLFDAAVDHLLRYHFYPDNVMQHYGTFSLDERPMQVGDRIVQRVHVLQLFNRPVVDAVTMTEVTAVINEPRRCGFTYATTTAHPQQGAWTAVVQWQHDNRVTLSISAISRPRTEEPERNYAWMRRLQKRAHRLGIDHFTRLVARVVPQPYQAGADYLSAA